MSVSTWENLQPSCWAALSRLVWRAAVKIRKLHPSAAVCIGAHTTLFLGFLPFLNQGREWKTWNSSLPLFWRKRALNPHHICLLRSWELNACLQHCDIILLGGKWKLEFMRRSSRAEWTKGCRSVEMCGKAWMVFGFRELPQCGKEYVYDCKYSRCSGRSPATPCSWCTFQSNLPTVYSGIM